MKVIVGNCHIVFYEACVLYSLKTICKFKFIPVKPMSGGQHIYKRIERYGTLLTGKVTLPLLLASMVLINLTCFSQAPVRVSEPKLKQDDNQVRITYDFLEGSSSDRYRVNAEITDVFGNMVHRLALSGDIGENVGGGRKKTIIWDLGVDRIYMEDDISVKIIAWPAMYEVTQAPEPPQSEDPVEENLEEPVADETVTDQPVNEQKVNPEIIPPNNNAREDLRRKAEIENPVYTRKSGIAYKRGGLVVQSLVLPGLGLSRLKRKPHWLRGLIGYGCLGGSVYLNREAAARLNTIPDNSNFNTQTDIFQQVVMMDNISEGLAYAAIGMWVIDFFWTVAGSSPLKKSSVYSGTEGFTLNAGVDPITHAPLLGISFRF